VVGASILLKGSCCVAAEEAPPLALWELCVLCFCRVGLASQCRPQLRCGTPLYCIAGGFSLICKFIINHYH